MFSETKTDNKLTRFLRYCSDGFYRAIVLTTIIACVLMAIMLVILFTTLAEPITGLSVATGANMLFGSEITPDMVVEFSSVMSLAFLMNSVIGFTLMALVLLIRKKFNI